MEIRISTLLEDEVKTIIGAWVRNFDQSLQVLTDFSVRCGIRVQFKSSNSKTIGLSGTKANRNTGEQRN